MSGMEGDGSAVNEWSSTWMDNSGFVHVHCDVCGDCLSCQIECFCTIKEQDK